MKNVFLMFLGLCLVQSCAFDTADNYFDRTTLNTNKLANFGSRELKMLLEAKKANSLVIIVGKEIKKTDNLEEHISAYIVPNLAESIKKVEDLKPTADTEAMITASLNLWNFAKEKYETDYMEIAKLADKGGSQEALSKLIIQFDEKNLPKLDQLRQELFAIAVPYAKENGIQIKGF